MLVDRNKLALFEPTICPASSARTGGTRRCPTRRMRSTRRLRRLTQHLAAAPAAEDEKEILPKPAKKGGASFRLGEEHDALGKVGTRNNEARTGV